MDSDLDATIRAWLVNAENQGDSDDVGDWGDGWHYFEAAATAITAVLDEHQPEPRPGRLGERDSAGEGFNCANETHACGWVNEYTPYPCSTVLAIAKALGIRVPGA